MSNLHSINRCTPSRCGNGLPFYDTLDNVFAKETGLIDSNDCLWKIPKAKMFTTQLELPVNTYVSFKYLASSGGVPIGAGNYTFGANPFTITPVVKNGVQRYIWETEGDGNLISPPPVGRWIAELVCSDTKKYYSEEFITTECF